MYSFKKTCIVISTPMFSEFLGSLLMVGKVTSLPEAIKAKTLNSYSGASINQGSCI